MHPDLSRRLVTAQLQEALDGGLLSGRVQLEEFSFPLLFVRYTNRRNNIRLLRFELSNYDFQAASIEPVDPATRRSLSTGEWMLRHGGPFPAHPLMDNRPFLCFPGTRDYFTHTGHNPLLTGERWERWRNELRLADVIRWMAGKFETGEWE